MESQKKLIENNIFNDAYSFSKNNLNNILVNFIFSKIIVRNKFDSLSTNRITNKSRLKKLTSKLIYYNILDYDTYDLSIKLLNLFLEKKSVGVFNLNNYRNLLGVSICVAHKYLDDECYNNLSFSSLLEMDIHTFNQLEIYFLLNINFKIYEI
jgi:hypothetical protein